LTDPGCELRKTKPLNFSVFHVGKFTNSEGDADNRTDNQEVEQSSRNNVHLEQLIDNCTPVEEGPIWLPKRLNDSMPNAKGY
jgi:hypothetical protein